MRIGFDAKRYYHNHTGLGNYARGVVGCMQRLFPSNDYLLLDEKTLSRTFRMATKARRAGCDLLHGLSNEIPLDSRMAHIPTVVTMHDVAWRTFPDMYHRADRIIYDAKYGWSARHASHVIAISESTRRDVQRFYGVEDERITVLYQPVQADFYTPMPRQEARRTVESLIPHLPEEYLLSVGSVNSRKNLLSVLQALAEVPESQRRPLLVVGNGRKYMAECRLFAAERLRRMNVHWLSSVTDIHILQALYTCATALLYPSHYEGFGLPVVEALLQRCPVLTSNVSSLPEAAGPGAILVDPTSVGAIKEGIVSLTEDASLRLQLATEGDAYCRRVFSPEPLTRQMMALYERI